MPLVCLQSVDHELVEKRRIDMPSVLPMVSDAGLTRRRETGICVTRRRPDWVPVVLASFAGFGRSL